MACKSELVDVMAVTTVAGNVPLELSSKNVLMTIEVTAAQQPPVYPGAAKPLFRDLVTAVGVHGHDGMGDCSMTVPSCSHN